MDQVSSVSYGSGNDTQVLGYDSLHRLTSDMVQTAAGAQVASIGYGYNANSNVTSMTTSGLAAPGGGTGTVANTYSYDEAGRLTGWNNGTAHTRGIGEALAPEAAGAGAAAGGRLLPGTTGVASSSTSSDWAAEGAGRQHEFDETTYDTGHAAENIGSTAENVWAALEPPPAPTGTMTGVSSGLPELTPGATVGVGDPLASIFLNGAIAARAIRTALRAIFGRDG
jgi:hypothetical protein